MPFQLRDSPPLFSLLRNGVPEISVHGVAALTLRDGTSNSKHLEIELVGRSLMKPFQALALDFHGDSPWAVADGVLVVASHSGQEQHEKALLALANRLEVDLEGLKCPKAYPMDSDRTCQMKAHAKEAQRIYHPCSGKHLAMMAAARWQSCPDFTYLNDKHPVQIRVREWIEFHARGKCRWVTDSCGLPAAVLTIASQLNLWRSLAEDKSKSAQELKKVWISNPFLAGGKGRLDSEIMAAFPGELLAKEGADGLLVVQWLGPTCFDSVLVKLASGYQSKYLALALASTIKGNQHLAPQWEKLSGYLNSRFNEWVPEDQDLQFHHG